MKTLVVLGSLLFLSTNFAFAKVGDEICSVWTEHTETKWFSSHGSDKPTYGWIQTGQRNHNNREYKRLTKRCVEWQPSTLDKLADKIGEKLEASISKNNEIMTRHLDQMEDIVGAATELQYQDFIKKLKAEMTKLRTELKQ